MRNPLKDDPRPSLLPLVVFLAFAACEEQRPGLGAPLERIVHPVPEGLLSSGASVSVREARLSDGPEELPEGLARLARFDPERALGEQEGPPELMLGSIREGAVTPDGRVLLVDADFGLVRVFSPEMEPLEMVGGFGDGPGEFVDPVTLVDPPSQGIDVVNHLGPYSRLERFEVQGDGHRFEDRLLLPLMAGSRGGDACRVGGRLFATGLLMGSEEDREGQTIRFLEGPGVVHEVDPEGEVLRSLPAAYRTPFERTEAVAGRRGEEAILYSLPADLQVAEIFGLVRLACGEEGLWVAYATLGEVHAFTPGGELRWIVRFPDLRFPEMVQSVYPHATSVGNAPGQGGLRERISQISLLAPDLLAVQVMSQGAGEEGPRDHRTYLIDPADGELLGVFAAGHRVIGGGHGRAILYREELHPEFEVVELER